VFQKTQKKKTPKKSGGIRLRKFNI